MNRARALEAQRARRQANPEAAAAYHREYRAKNRARINLRVATRRAQRSEEMRDYHREYHKAYRAKNRSVLLARKALYYRENKDKHRKWARDANRRRYASGQARLSHAMSRGVWGVLRGRKGGRSAFALLGYDEAQLRARLETNFLPGMSWDNYGEWHVDHRKPVSWFGRLDPGTAAFRACWSLANLRPLWSRDNISKGNRFAA